MPHLTEIDRRVLVVFRVIAATSETGWISIHNQSQLSPYRVLRLEAAGYLESKPSDGCGQLYRVKQP